MTDTKRCANMACTATIHRRSGMSRRAWQKQKFCSLKCAQSGRAERGVLISPVESIYRAVPADDDPRRF